MADEKQLTLQNLTEVIALPPLRMVLVHAKDERENNAIRKAAIKSVAQQEHVEPQALKKIIEHLEKKV